MKKNIEVLYRLSVIPEVWRPLDVERFPGIEKSVIGTSAFIDGKQYYPLAKRYSEAEWRKQQNPLSSIKLMQGFRSSDNNYLCYINGTAASYCVVFQPQTAVDLAYLAGCSIEKLPDILQHWCVKTDYRGNRNLKRIDPMAWALYNPWSKMSFVVELHLSIRALKNIERNYQAPNDFLLPETLETNGRASLVNKRKYP